MGHRSTAWRRLATVVVTAGLVVACSGGGGTASPGGSAAPTTGGASGAPPASGGSGGTGFQFEQLGGSVSVVGSWSGSEQDSFLAMVKPWEDGTGAKVNYTGSRDLSAQLTAGIASGTLPDLAGLPGPGLMKEWYGQGALKPLDFVDFNAYSSSTPAGFAELGQGDDGKLIGIFTKAAVKGLIFYNVKNWTDPAPATWDELTSAATGKVSGDEKVWCIGVESGAASGWPGTDWLEDII
ncbi:MAG TPA: extracellular solute-binding protein, partial [Candidatus Limnocylindrales bacterium]|nr:extracellular solute-binding protein [Candidatus Limnocylindrales bacterium]